MWLLNENSLTCRHPQAPLYFTRITPDSSAINVTKRGTKSDFLPFRRWDLYLGNSLRTDRI